MGDGLKLLLRLYWEPGAAMSAILDRGSLLLASVSVAAVSLLLESGAGRWLHFGFYVPLLVLAAVYVPGVLLLANLLGRLGGLGMVFQRDYSPLLTSTAMAWAAANLPLVLAGWTAPPEVFAILAALAYLYFAVLMFFAVRTVFGVDNGAAAGVVCLSWIPLVAAAFLWGPLRFLMGWLASPFFLFYAFYFLRADFSGLGAGLRSRQNFRRTLDAAAVNPHDGEAQYQLGLVYQERRQYTEAIRRFQNAVRIDPGETDAHFQLGRIARQQGRLDDALVHFQTVLAQDPKHSSSEILRETAAAYLARGRYQEARRALAVYTERREYDPEGLYYYGQALEGLGDPSGAREMYRRAVEAARTAPPYRRRFTARWSRLAQKQERKLSVG
ncbi:MAG: tetratricopeptide repeat protein [Acidobacteriia bacterium]|nr:tetratricopeptide repeat protein [Terriglobia bacterium]